MSHGYLGIALLSFGRYQEAAEYGERALELEPDSALIAYIVSAHYLWMRDFVRAEQFAARSLALEPDAAFAHWMYGNALVFQGRVEEAVSLVERGAELGERQPVLLTGLGHA